jgi:hypothetical protein
MEGGFSPANATEVDGVAAAVTAESEDADDRDSGQ